MQQNQLDRRDKVYQPLYILFFTTTLFSSTKWTVPVTDAGSSDDDDVEENDGKGYDGNGNNNNSDGDDDFVELLQIFQDQYRSFMACFNYIYIYQARDTKTKISNLANESQQRYMNSKEGKGKPIRRKREELNFDSFSRSSYCTKHRTRRDETRIDSQGRKQEERESS